MAKIIRKQQKIFGANALSGQIGIFGSLAAGSPATTTDPETIQSLSQYLSGWYAGVIGSNSPAIEDMNALFYLLSYQIAYVLQNGIPEWNSQTTYYIGSIVQDGNGVAYRSLVNNNTNISTSTTTHWAKAFAPIIQTVNTTSIPTNITLTASDDRKVFLINTNNGICNINLPAPILNFSFSIKDAQGKADTNPITIVRYGTEQIENSSANYVMDAVYGTLKFICDGTSWFIVNS